MDVSGEPQWTQYWKAASDVALPGRCKYGRIDHSYARAGRNRRNHFRYEPDSLVFLVGIYLI